MIETKLPLYLQIKQQIINDIFQGIYEEDSLLPSVRQLSVDLTTNPNTVQKVYRELENEGYIYTILGKGSYIKDKDTITRLKKEYLQSELYQVYSKLIDNGFTHETIINALNSLANVR